MRSAPICISCSSQSLLRNTGLSKIGAICSGMSSFLWRLIIDIDDDYLKIIKISGIFKILKVVGIWKVFNDARRATTTNDDDDHRSSITTSCCCCCCCCLVSTIILLVVAGGPPTLPPPNTTTTTTMRRVVVGHIFGGYHPGHIK